MNYSLQPCNREAAITELCLQDCFTLLSSYSINDPLLVSPAKHIFFPCSNNYSCPLIPSWEHFSYLGAKGLHSTCSTFPQHPRVKGFTPPRNFPVTWKHVQDTAQTSGYVKVIIQASESQEQVWPFCPSQTDSFSLNAALFLSSSNTSPLSANSS